MNKHDFTDSSSMPLKLIEIKTDYRQEAFELYDNRDALGLLGYEWIYGLEAQFVSFLLPFVTCFILALVVVIV